eukprot:TRINITY_DN4780_c5_g1_i1.p1 TRINITY_DN4780_c5_g1~~TRINITY_DN4780_c5_g1_i1.p1  ORF type:complete len:104 (+),score=28.08 TRINITY_DN4780_c5_g1_i1:140-451(+)
MNNAGLILLVCLIVDFLGVVTLFIPILEIFDLAWAPISAYIIYYLFGSAPASILGFIEELLPGLDFIPTATIAFIYFYSIAYFGIKEEKENDKKKEDENKKDK